ncbi:MAG: bifunctional indole-3-glycerol phosphate synthase/phosphoribosylanthranilate isomerase [Spirochaetota bacterium]|nr:MAG: bifunctional indole-3-glycerol phosphate synthase/phosphoribosylanthranilate isomerase [Spirochaetota bacterium]
MSRIDEIVSRRRKRIQRLGPEMGVKIPEKRVFPVSPFGRDPFFICEIKRASPSRGNIVSEADAVVQAGLYRDMGIKTVSVLTEEEYFSGSLNDLLNVKKQFPDLSVLRKDFLVSEEDIEVSYRAGADAVLLIASMHSGESLYALYKKARSLGIEVLVEVHDKDDIDKARRISPHFTGFNSRDLKTFKIDPIQPVRLRHLVTWNTSTVFESGITTDEHALFALSSGFSGILVGEAVMKNRELILEMKKHFEHKNAEFWLRLYKKRVDSKPLVKICGITNERDAELARKMGADLLGFIFAPSPRKTAPELLKALKGLDILKVAVVVQEEGDTSIDPEVKDLLEEGLIDAVQFHGNESARHCYEMAFPYYKALRIQKVEDIEKASQFRCPRVLLDSFVPGKLGGTGQRLSHEVLGKAKEKLPLWLAGGIGPENVREIVKTYSPELIDASSALEASPAKKSHEKIKTFFQEIALG